MYKCIYNRYPKCGRTCFCCCPDPRANHAVKRQNPIAMHNIHDCSYNRKFMKTQKWRRRLCDEQVLLTSTLSSRISVMRNSARYSSIMLTLITIILLLGCCQGNHIQPASAKYGSELSDIMVPVGTAFHYKIPHSIFNCQVEHLMVTGSDDRFLPHWLAFDSIEGTLRGIPLNSDIGTNTILVVAIVEGELKRGNICGSKTFVITVPPEGDTIPVPLMSVAFQSAVVGDDGALQFNNPNLHHRIMCFPGVHTTFASVIINADFSQLNGNQRITMLQQMTDHLGLNGERVSAFSDLYPHPLISGLEFPSLVATGAGDGRFVKGVKTVFTWPLGCGAIKINKTLLSHLTKSSQDGTFSDSVKHSIFGWHITSGVQKTLPKIRVRRAPLVGTPTPTATVAMPTAVTVSRTTIVINSTASLVRLKPSTSLTPINISSLLPEQTLSAEVSSSAEFSAILKTSLSLPQVQSYSTTSYISSINVDRTKITTTNIGVRNTLLTPSPGTLSFTKNLTFELSSSLSVSTQTTTFSLVPRTISVVEKISTSLNANQNATLASTVADTRFSSTSVHARSFSSKSVEQSIRQTSSRTVIQQTSVLTSSAPYTTKPISALHSTASLTSLSDVTSLTSSFVPSIPPLLTSDSTVSDFLISSSVPYIEPSSSVTIETEIGKSVTLKSFTSSANQTSRFSVLFATLNVSSSKRSYIQTKVLNTTSVIKALTTSSSVALHLSKSSDSSPSLGMSFDMTSFTSTLPLSSTFAKSSQRLITTALSSVHLPNSSFTPRSSSEIVHLPNTTAVTMAEFESVSSTFSIISQVTQTTVVISAVQSTSGLQVSSTAPLAETLSPTSTRSLAMVNHTVSQVLSASLSNSTFIPTSESAESLSLSSSVGDIDSLTVSSVLNKTTVVLMTESQESPVLRTSTKMVSSEQLSSVTATDELLSPTAISYSTISQSSKMTSEVDSSKLYTSVVSTVELPSATSVSVFTVAVSSNLTAGLGTSKRFSSVAATHSLLSTRIISISTKVEVSRLTQTQSASIKPTFTPESLTSGIVVSAGSKSSYSTMNTSETTQMVFSPAATLPSSVATTGYLSSSSASQPTETLITYSVPLSVISATSTHLDFSTLPPITPSSLAPELTVTKSEDLVSSFGVTSSSVSLSSEDLVSTFGVTSSSVSLSSEDLVSSFGVTSSSVSLSVINKTGAVRSFSETSPFVSSSAVTKTEDRIMSSSEQTLFVSSTLITMTEDVTTSFSEQSLVVPSIVTKKSGNIFTSVTMITASSSLFFISSRSNVIVPVSSHFSAIQSVSASTPVTHVSRVSSSITGIFNLTVTSDVIELSTPVLTQTPSGTQTAALSSKELLDTRSLPTATTQAISTFSERTFITESASLPSFASTVIPTSVIPTLAPSTGPTVPPNDRPVRLNDIGRLEAKVGKVFRYVVPRDVFYDREDGDTRNLSLSCSLILQGALPRGYWLQFDSKRQELFGLPLPSDYEKYSGSEDYQRYVLTAHDSQGQTARDVFQIVMVVVTDTVTQQLSIRTSNDYTVFISNVVQRLDLVQRIKTYYGDEDASAIRILSVTQGSLVVTWSNDTLPSDRCDEEAVQWIATKAVLSGGEVNPAFRNALEPAFPIQNAKEERVGFCNVTETYPTVPIRGQRSTSETDTWLKHVLPGILVALLLIILALILVTYLRKRRPQPANPEKFTYKKRKPIVLGEEIELKTVPAKPLILPDDDFGWSPSHLPVTSLDKPQHYDTDEDEVDFGKRTPSVKYELPPPFYSMNESLRDTPPPSYKLPPPYKF